VLRIKVDIGGHKCGSIFGSLMWHHMLGLAGATTHCRCDISRTDVAMIFHSSFAAPNDGFFADDAHFVQGGL